MTLLRRALAAIAAMLVTTAAADAHPLGNFTVNHLDRLTVDGSVAHVRYVLDEAEIPSFAVLRSLDAHGTPSQAALHDWARTTARDRAADLTLSVDDNAVALTPAGVTVTTRPGAGGLRTIYLVADYDAPLGAGAHRLALRDASYPGRIGWHDVVVGAEREPTNALRSYPAALLGSPRDRTTRVASLGANGLVQPLPDEAAASAAAAGPSIARNDALSEALARGGSSPLIVLGALLLAIGLGALHALEPGHGKTLLAVSLVGARATVSQAVILAGSLTLAHTIGVLALGVVVLLFAHWIVPETIYPWLTLLSGAVVAVLGARALAREITRRRGVAHAHRHAHPHAHPHAHDHLHGAADDHHAHDHALLDDEAHARAHAIPGQAPLTFRSALLAAATGNVAPCPAALVVLLAAIALHRVGYGLALIVAFSLGLALVLTGLGLAVVRSAAWLSANPRFDRVARYGPLVTASVISVLGASILAQGLVQQGIGAPVVFVAALVLAAIAGYAFTAGAHVHVRPSAQEARA